MRPNLFVTIAGMTLLALSAPLTPQSHELRKKKRAQRSGSSRGSSDAVDIDTASPAWKEASGDLMTPGSTPSSLLPSGQRKRRGTAGSAGHTPGATPTVNQLTVGSARGSIPGSANSEDSLVPDSTDTPLIARIPEETLRASVEAGKVEDGDENAE